MERDGESKSSFTSYAVEKFFKMFEEAEVHEWVSMGPLIFLLGLEFTIQQC